MPSLHTLSTFFGVAVLLALTPGPDNLFVLLQSAQRGWRAGMAVVLGLCLGLMVHTAAVALGLAALFAASPTAFTVLKFCGAAYLAWLAWQALRAPAGAGQDEGQQDEGQDAAEAGSAGDAARGEQEQTAAAQAVPAVAPGLLRMVGRGMLMNLTNPKVLIFFLAFLPQFTDPALASS